jgi:aspartate/tyrosine/aromatic aminotransferase
MYSNPPMHGALLVHKVLSNPAYYQRWADELSVVSKRIIEVRSLLKAKLLDLKTPGNWDHIVNQIGMFSYTGLSGNINKLYFRKNM